MKNIVDTNNVNYLRLDKSEVIELEKENMNFKLGKMRLFATGKDVTFISSGGILEEVIIAAKDLLERDISSNIFSCHSIKPIDSKSIKGRKLFIKASSNGEVPIKLNGEKFNISER